MVVYGATGYTGKLISAELARRDADFVIAGRNGDKLEALAATLDAEPAVAAVALDDPAGMRGLLDGAASVIACAGPFTLHGRAVLEAATATGTHYVDTTGEQLFIRSVFEDHGEAAGATGAALVSGMGFDYALGDLLAARTAEGLGDLEELVLAYTIRGFSPTRGTALSALEMISGGDVEWERGAYREAARTTGRGSFDFPSPIGRRRVDRYPAGEQITVPKHVNVETVKTLIDRRGLLGFEAGPLGAPLMTAIGYAMGTPLADAAAKLIARMPEGPPEAARKAVRYTIVCEARSNRGTRRGVIRGGDIYGTTAVCTVEGALRMATPGYDSSGALAPAQAYDPADFLAALRPHGVICEPARVG